MSAGQICNVGTGASNEEDDHCSDLEVASVLSKEMHSHSTIKTISPCKSTTPAKYNYSPFRPSTVMTNVSRGNIRTTTITPICRVDINVHQMAAQGELILLQEELSYICYGHREATEITMENTMDDINVQDEHGFTLMMWAAANNQLATVEWLLDRGGDVNLCGKQGENALVLASSNGHDRVVRCLLKMGMDVNHACLKGNTALLYAAYNNHVECVKAILEWGGDLTAQNKLGHSAMDIVITLGHKHVQNVMEKHLLQLLDPS